MVSQQEAINMWPYCQEADVDGRKWAINTSKHKRCDKAAVNQQPMVSKVKITAFSDHPNKGSLYNGNGPSLQKLLY